LLALIDIIKLSGTAFVTVEKLLLLLVVTFEVVKPRAVDVFAET
jgi:hypothetical protein